MNSLGNTAEHETKFVFRNDAAHVVTHWLERHCRPDREYPVGFVSSLYYDTADWRLLDEKRNSDFAKTKVRVRWYESRAGGASSGPAHLEVKRKLGSRREKLRLPAGVSGAWLAGADPRDPKLMELPRSLVAEGIFLPGPLIPAFSIRYERHRFVDPRSGARLCLDRNIAVEAVNPRMVPRARPVRLRQAVFELKGNTRELPHGLARLTALGARKSSFSKYAICYRALVGESD